MGSYETLALVRSGLPENGKDWYEFKLRDSNAIQKYLTETSKAVPWVVARGSLLDLVQRPIKMR